MKNLYGESLNKWRKQVFLKDNYTCQCCKVKGGFLNAHHIDGYNWYKKGRFDDSNGVTLCKKCHHEFHLQYGFGDNTDKQYKEFIENMKVSERVLFTLSKGGDILNVKEEIL